MYWSKRPAVPPLPWSSPVITTAAFSPRGRNQKRGSGLRSRFICSIRFASRRCCSSACGIATLSRFTQSGWTSPAWRRRRGRRSGSGRGAVALLPGPGRVALARVDDRTGEVVGERGRLPAVRADAAQRHRRVRGGGAWRPSRAWRSSGRRRSCSGRPCRGTESSVRRCRRPGRSAVSTWR